MKQGGESSKEDRWCKCDEDKESFGTQGTSAIEVMEMTSVLSDCSQGTRNVFVPSALQKSYVRALDFLKSGYLSSVVIFYTHGLYELL